MVSSAGGLPRYDSIAHMVVPGNRNWAFWRGFRALDWIRIALLLAGIACVLTGLLPAAEAESNLRRIAPLLLFLGSVIVLAKLAKEAQVFDALATWFAILARGNYGLLFLLCVGLASATTSFLNLDTTAVLLTPVMLAVAARARIAELPLAMTTIWLANTASNLLPVSNLTNLLAADRVALEPAAFAARMWAPQLASIAVTMVFLWVFYWRRGERGEDRYVPPPPVRIEDRLLFWTAVVACVGFIVAMMLGVELEYASLVAAVILVAGFAWRDRTKLRLDLVPWWLLVFVVGLFLVVPTLSRFGLDAVMSALIGTDGGVYGVFRAGLAGAGLSNLVNNLPAYTAGEAVVPIANHDQLLGLLLGTNVGPVITPWSSLATLLCIESCAYHGVRIPMRRFVLIGLGLAVAGVLASITALLLTSPRL
jgi:arsenical pump membrane protein